MPRVHNKYHKTAPEGAVYVGRPSIWGNPFIVDKNRNNQELARKEAVENYREWIYSDSPRPVVLRAKARFELAGKDLVCYCAPKPCHADILIEIANEE